MSRSACGLRRVRGRAGGIASTVLALAVLAACGQGTPPPPAASVGVTLDRTVPARIADLPLTDDQGRTTDLAALHGKVVVLTDFLTLCQDVCPLTSANFAAMDRDVRNAGLGGRVQFVELTVDPERDTPARLAAYRQLFGAPANWSLLTASPQVIAQVWSFFGAWYQRVPEDSPPGIDWWTHEPLTYDMDHQDVLVYLNPSGRQRFVIGGLPNSERRRPPAALQRFLSDLGRQHLAHPAPDAWTVSQALSALSWVLGRSVRPVS